MSQSLVELELSVPGISCSHCQTAIISEVAKITGVSTVDVDLAKQRVTVHGDHLEHSEVVAAIDDAGYDVA